jgi:hypothetical protein
MVVVHEKTFSDLKICLKDELFKFVFIAVKKIKQKQKIHNITSLKEVMLGTDQNKD